MQMNNTSFRVSRHNNWPTREFNPLSKEDLTEYSYFIENGRWKSRCPFVLEWPFLSIPTMIEHKFVRQHIQNKITAKG